jgi:hypothetical protein
MTMTSQEPKTESDLLRAVADSVRERLPGGWKVDLRLSPRLDGWRPDALLEISAPDGKSGVLLIEAKLVLEPRSVAPMLEMLEQALVDADLPPDRRGPPMVVARFISPRARELLCAAGASYADATGNLRVTLGRPAVFIQAQGAESNPWAEVRDLRSLKGRMAVRVVRAVCDLRTPFGVRELASRSGTSAGSAVRVLEFLSREALIVRDKRKQVVEVELAGLVQRWASDFRFTQQNAIGQYLEPRRIEPVLDRLRAIEGAYAVTGSFAANAVAPYAEARLLVVYANDAEMLRDALGVRAATGPSNIWIAQPPDDLPFVRTWTRDGIRYAALSQVACDLYDMPGRSSAEADELLRWMETNPDAWRTD